MASSNVANRNISALEPASETTLKRGQESSETGNRIEPALNNAKRPRPSSTSMVDANGSALQKGKARAPASKRGDTKAIQQSLLAGPNPSSLAEGGEMYSGATEPFSTPKHDRSLEKTKAASPCDGVSTASTTVKAPPSPQDLVQAIHGQENGDHGETVEQKPGSLLPVFDGIATKTDKKRKSPFAGKTKVKGKASKKNPSSASSSPIKKKTAKGADGKKAVKKLKDKAKPNVKGSEKRSFGDKNQKMTSGEPLVGEVVADPLVAEDSSTQPSTSMLTDVPGLPKLAEDESEECEKEGEWRTSGSKFLGRTVLRTTISDDGTHNGACATVVGWLPVHESDFCNEETGIPGALWNVRYHDESLGCEDLEEWEVEEAVRAFELSTSATNKKKKKLSMNGGSTKDMEDIDRILEHAQFYIVREAGTKIGDIAEELGVDVQTLIRLNCNRHAGLKQKNCKLHAHTLLFYTRESSRPSGQDTQIEGNSPEAHSTRMDIDVAPSAQHSAPGEHDTQASGEDTQKSDTESASKPTPQKTPQRDATPQKTPQKDLAPIAALPAGKPRSDWHFAKRPVLAFPPYPGVTEKDGVSVAIKFRSCFSCPFKIEDGVVYATSGFEAVAPITATVEDNWAECDECHKWRRLPGTLIVAEGNEFFCSDMSKTCLDPEDDWDDGEEIEVANDTIKCIEAKLPLTIGDLTVTALGIAHKPTPLLSSAFKASVPKPDLLQHSFPHTYFLTSTGNPVAGEVLSDKAGFWNQRVIYPVGYRCTRRFVTNDATKQKTDFLCEVEAGDDGPVFRVTPKDDQNQVMRSLSATGKTPTRAWSTALSKMKRKKANSPEKEKDQTPVKPKADEQIAPNTEETSQNFEASSQNNDSPFKNLIDRDATPSSEIASMQAGVDSPSTADANRVGREDEDLFMEDEGSGEEDDDKNQATDTAGTTAGKTHVSGNALFGFTLKQVMELVEALPGADEIIKYQYENAEL